MTASKSPETVEGVTIPSHVTDAGQVLAQLNRILESQAFRNSKRYTRFLKFAVEQALLGHGDQLKERLLGIEVYDRAADYDVATDPIVRIAAGEVRKRLAQYYVESGHEDELQIHMYPGSYVPEFSPPRQRITSQTEEVPSPTPTVSPDATAHDKFLRTRGSVSVALALTAVGLTTILVWIYTTNQKSPLERFWSGLIQSNSQPVFCLGNVTPDFKSTGGAEPEGLQTGISSSDHLALSDVQAFNRISDYLARHGKRGMVLNSESASLSDIRQNATVLIGGSSNQWTMKSMQFLRYRIVRDLRPNVNAIVDAQNGSQPRWSVDFNARYDSIPKEYGIVARFHNPITDQPTVIIAGIGANGTIAASDFLTSPAYFTQFSDKAPRNWSDHNLEIILETEMINGDYGPPKVMATYIW